MKDPKSELPELEIPQNLANLIKYCEKGCVADCCGICAFDFSPLHIASYLSTHTGAIGESDINQWVTEILTLEDNFESLATEGDELVCTVSSMNQHFTTEAVRAFVAELRCSVMSAPEVLNLSNQLASSERAYIVMNNYGDRQRLANADKIKKQNNKGCCEVGAIAETSTAPLVEQARSDV